MLRRLAALVATAGLAGGALVAGQPAQAHHCSQMIMFSSHAAVGVGLNPGVGGCLLVNYDDPNNNTNLFLPGADRLSVGLSADPKGWDLNNNGVRDDVVTLGTLTVTYADPTTGEPVTVTDDLVWTWNGTSRWNSPNITYPGRLLEATGEVLTQPNVVVSVTYTDTPEATR